MIGLGDTVHSEILAPSSSAAACRYAPRSPTRIGSDQTFPRRKNGAAERILILGANDDRHQRRELRGKGDEVREMILLIDDQLREDRGPR